jgi:hypothetical protein
MHSIALPAMCGLAVVCALRAGSDATMRIVGISHLSSYFTPHGTHNQVWTAGTHPGNHLTRGTDSLQQQQPTHRLFPATDGIVQHPKCAAAYSGVGGGALVRGEGGDGGMAKRTRQTCCS